MKKTIKRKVPSKGLQVRLKGLEARVNQVEKLSSSAEAHTKFKAGDTVRVHVKIKEGDKERVQPYEGLCIAMSNKGGSKSFTVRKMSHGVGVERIFMFSSPKVARIEIVQVGKVRRAKLYYIRELEGRAAKIEREVETQAQTAAKAAAKTAAKAAK